MNGFVKAIDAMNTWIGKAFSWLIVGLTFAICYEVVARYAFRAPTAWAYDVSLMFYGTLFMMAGAYTLARNGHVRGDFLYRDVGAAHPGVVRSRPLLPVLFPRHPGARLRRLELRAHVLAVQRALLVQPGRADHLAVQVRDPDRRRADDAAGHRRGHPLHPVHPDRRVAGTAARRRGVGEDHPRAGGPTEATKACADVSPRPHQAPQPLCARAADDRAAGRRDRQRLALARDCTVARLHAGFAVLAGRHGHPDARSCSCSS